MADNIDVTPGSGKTVATDDVAGVQFQKIKIDVGGDGASAPLSSTNTIPATIYSGGTAVDWSAPVPVTQSGTWNVGINATSATAGQVGPIVQGSVTTSAPAYTHGQTNFLSLTTGGALRVDTALTTIAVTQATASSLNAQVAGDVAPATADSGNPIKIGAVYNASSPPTYTTGQRGNAQMGQRGSLCVQIMGRDSTVGAGVTTTGADGFSAGNQALQTWSAGTIMAADATWSRMRGIDAAGGATTGVLAVEQNGATFRNINSAATTQVKNSAGILHKIVVNTGVASATISVYDATSGTTNPVAVITCPVTITNPFELAYDLYCSTGIRVITSGATDVTVVYR